MRSSVAGASPRLEQRAPASAVSCARARHRAASRARDAYRSADRPRLVSTSTIGHQDLSTRATRWTRTGVREVGSASPARPTRRSLQRRVRASRILQMPRSARSRRLARPAALSSVRRHRRRTTQWCYGRTCAHAASEVGTISFFLAPRRHEPRDPRRMRASRSRRTPRPSCRTARARPSQLFRTPTWRPPVTRGGPEIHRRHTASSCSIGRSHSHFASHLEERFGDLRCLRCRDSTCCARVSSARFQIRRSQDLPDFGCPRRALASRAQRCRRASGGNREQASSSPNELVSSPIFRSSARCFRARLRAWPVTVVRALANFLRPAR